MNTKRKLTDQERQEFRASLRAGVLLVTLELFGVALLIALWPDYITPARILTASLLVCTTFIGPPAFVLNFQGQRARYLARKAATPLNDLNKPTGG